MTNFQERVYKLTAKIPRGKVTTYKIIAEKLRTKAYRSVGTALSKNPYAPKIPCHRVISSDGSIGGFKGKKTGKPIKEKIKMLEKEGVQIYKGKIVKLKQTLYKF